MDSTWIPALRQPSNGDTYPWIQKHEHTHATRAGEGAAACGYHPNGWIKRSAWCCEITCLDCRRILGLGPNTLTPDDDQWSWMLHYK